MTMDDSEKAVLAVLFLVGIVSLVLGVLPGPSTFVFFIIGIVILALCLIVIIIDNITNKRKKATDSKRITSRSLSSRRESRELKKISSRSRSSPSKHSSTPSISHSFPANMDSLPESATEAPSPLKCSSCGKKVKKPPYFCYYCGQDYF